MNKKLVLIGILLLVSLMLSGCLPPPPFPGYGYGRSGGYYGDSHGHDRGDRDRDYRGSGHGSRH